MPACTIPRTVEEVNVEDEVTHQPLPSRLSKFQPEDSLIMCRKASSTSLSSHSDIFPTTSSHMQVSGGETSLQGDQVCRSGLQNRGRPRWHLASSKTVSRREKKEKANVMSSEVEEGE